MSLHIGWASPWNMQSAVARFGIAVTTELITRGHSVDILRTEVDTYRELPVLPHDGVLRNLAELSPMALRQEYDVVIVNLGNHYGFHGAGLRALPQLGAVVILHDQFCSNQIRLASTETEMLPTGTCGSKLEWLARLIIGAVVDSEHDADRVRKFCTVPVASIPLAYPDPGLPPLAPFVDDLVVLIPEHGNLNKYADRLIMAIASSPDLRRRCRCRLIGQYDDLECERLLALARHLGVASPAFLGVIEDSDLPLEYGKAHVICCLHDSLSGRRSVFAILGMLSARPLLVHNDGAYAEIPGDLVGKCARGEETTDVARHLRAILHDPAAAQAQGRRARDYALDCHSARAYADHFLHFIDRAITTGPAIMARIAVGLRLASFGLRPEDAAVTEAVRPLADLLEATR